MSSEVLNRPVVSEALREQFRTLRERWKRDTYVLSDPDVILSHPVLKEIMRLGTAVIPLMMEEMERGPSLWCWVLPEIVGIELATPEIAGDVAAQTERWLAWGREQGYR